MSNFLLHGGTLAFAWFLIVNIVLSAAVAVWAARAPRGGIGDGSATLWFAARVGPAAAALLFVAGVFVPSYWKYEPRDFVEGFDVTLTALGVGAACLLVSAGARGLRAWRSAAHRTRVWMQTARPIAFAGTRIPAFEIDADAPIMALVGVLRPRLLVTRGLVAALTDEELDASVAHEVGHSRALDNLKRLLMSASPDILTSSSSARTIERRWASASEHSADRLAASGGRATRCALASALVKIARLMPPATTAVNKSEGWEPISTLVDGGEIVSRVERLLADPPPLAPRRRSTIAWTGALAVVAAACATNYMPLLQLVHTATEALVHSLP